MSVNRLLFEGSDDQAVVMNLLYNHHANGSPLEGLFQAKDKKGIANLLSVLPEELKATDLRNLGIVLDADSDPEARWAALAAALAQVQLALPQQANLGGTLLTRPDGRKVGVWLMPDNQRSGTLEDFVASLIAPDDALWPRAGLAVDVIPETQRRFRPTYLAKAKVHTWLAWQEEPGTRMGQTFKKRYIDPQCPSAQALAGWVRLLLD